MNPEHRQHINLSDHAEAVVLSDISIFKPNMSFGGFLNEAFLRSRLDADASISLRRDSLRERYLELLRKARYRNDRPKDPEMKRYVPNRVLLSDGEKALVEQLVEGALYGLAKKANDYPKGNPHKIYLNKEVYGYLYPEGGSWPEERYYRTPGLYLKAVIEEYAEKSPYEREGIVFKQEIDQLRKALDLPPEARRVQIIERVGNNGTVKYYLKPYCLAADSGMNYHYVAGLAKEIHEPAEAYRPVSFRVSRLSNIEELGSRYGSGRITAKERKTLDAALKQKGIQYLVGDSSVVKVRVTKQGYEMYKHILHLRPMCVSAEDQKDGGAVLEFDCTKKQLIDYFHRFGAHAVVLDAAIAHEFETWYEEAARAYKQSAAPH